MAGQDGTPGNDGAPKDTDTGAETPDNDAGTGGDAGTDDDDEELGPAGVKALEAEKAKRKALATELRAFKNLGLTVEQIAEMKKPISGKKTPAEGTDKDAPDAEAIRNEARAEARKEALRERVTDKIEAKAAKFADAEDAVAILLRSSKIDDYIDGDKIDVEAITEALEDLGKKKPHLLAQGKRFQGGSDGGARKGSEPSIDDQIAAATKAGNLQLAIALKQRRAAELANK